MKELEQYRVCMEKLPDGCREAEAEAEKLQIVSVMLSDGELSTMECSEQTEIFVRASGEKTGMTYTQKLDESASDVIQKALNNSEFSEAQQMEIMADTSLWEDVDEDNNQQLKQDTTDELCAFAGKLYDEIKQRLAESNVESGSLNIEVRQTIQTMGIVNSTLKGKLDRSFQTARYEVTVAAESGYSGFLSAEKKEDIFAEYFAEGMTKRSVIGTLPVEKVIPGDYRTVLSSETMNFIMITAWQLFSGIRAYNGSTPICAELGKKIFADSVTIRDYCDTKQRNIGIPGGYCWKMDCEGVPAQNMTLVENGVLKSWMHNLSSAAKTEHSKDMKCTAGAAGRKALLGGNIHTDTVIVPKTFTLEPGNTDFEELISKCGDGIYIYECYDQFHSLNISSGEFAFPCKGIIIRDKKPAAVAEGLTMNGNVCSLFKDILLVGNDPGSYAFPIYQNYEVCSPSVLVKTLRICG